VLHLPKTRYRDGVIRVKQSKTNVLGPVPLHEAPDLMQEIEAALAQRTETTTIVTNEATGRPWTRHHLARKVKEVPRAAGLNEDLWFEDLRRIGLTEGGDSGASAQQLKALGSIKTLAILNTYVLPTDYQAGRVIKLRQKMRTKKGPTSEKARKRTSE